MQGHFENTLDLILGDEEMILKRFFFLLILVVLAFGLIGCGGDDPTAPPTPAATEEAPPPTEEAPPATEEVLPAATEEPLATAEPLPTDTPEPITETARVRVGILRFSDNESARTGDFRLQIAGIPVAPDGSHYQLWLVSNDGQTMLDLGDFNVTDSAVDYSDSTDQNLLAGYAQLLISLEPNGDTDPAISNQIVYDGGVAPESLMYIRFVVDQFATTPAQVGLLVGAQEQMDIAIYHSGLALESLAAGNLAEAKLHTEHVVNVLEGTDGPNYGDWDGDGLAQNPGDGFGVRAYLDWAKQQTALAAAPGASEEVVLHSAHVIVSADNAIAWLTEAEDAALRLLSSDSASEAQSHADQMNQLVNDVLVGRDLNADNYAAPAPGEGAIQTAYEHAQFMGGFELFITGGTAAPPPAGTTPEPLTDTATVSMIDFEFVPKVLTVPAGTDIVWVNNGAVQHSATADDGTFDTGLFNAGGQATITFDTPGSYAYYCALHGAAGGSGMAGTIVVTAGTSANPNNGLALPAGFSAIAIAGVFGLGWRLRRRT